MSNPIKLPRYGGDGVPWCSATSCPQFVDSIDGGIFPQESRAAKCRLLSSTLMDICIPAVQDIAKVARAAEALCDQPMIDKPHYAVTWGDVAQSSEEGPRLIVALRDAVDAARGKERTRG